MSTLPPGASALTLSNHISGADKQPRAADFVRGSQTPIFTNSMQTALTSIYWNWVVRVDDKVSNPLATYYMFYSTDHDPSAGGIALMYSNSPLGPWTPYGKVYTDPYSNGTTQAGQTETPSVIWDEENSLFVMYYQQQGASFGSGNTTVATGVQSTLRCTSPDGINWTKDTGFILDKQYSSQVPGDGHTGYFLPFRIDGALFGYHLYGGTNFAHFALSKMYSPGQAALDPRELGFYPNFVPSPDGNVRYISWNAAFPFRSRGRLMLMAMCTTWVSATTPKNAFLAVFPLSRDFRKPLGRGRIIWQPTLSWENQNVRSVTPFLDYDGTLYTYYMTNADPNGNPRPASGGTASNVGVIVHAC